jgi:hypothetical protein
MNVGFEVLTEVVMKDSVFRDIMSCNLLKVSRWLSTDYTVLCPKRQNSQYECSLPFKQLQSKPICSVIPLQQYGRALCSETNLVRPPPTETLTFGYGTLSVYFATTALEKSEEAGSSETSENLYHTTQRQSIAFPKTIDFTDISYALRNSPIYFSSHRSEQNCKHNTARN